MTLLVEKLETLDQNNVLSIRRQILALKTKLKECEDSKSGLVPATPPPPAPGKPALYLFLPCETPISSLDWGWGDGCDCSVGG